LKKNFNDKNIRSGSKRYSSREKQLIAGDAFQAGDHSAADFLPSKIVNDQS
jgi:hypothetical protein